MSATANRVIKNTAYLYAKMGITMFVSLYTTRLILNGLGASDFGIFNIVGGAIAMLGFLNAAMANATQRFMSYAEGEGNKEKQKYIFNISIVLHAAIAVIVGIALVGAGWFFFNGILTIPADRVFAAEVVYASLIVSTMFTVMSVPYDAVLNAHENMRYYALVGVFESFLKLAVAFACVYSTGDKLIVYGILMAAIPLVTLTIMRIYCHRYYAECLLAPRRYYDKALVKEMTGFAGWNFLRSASSIVGNSSLSVIMNHFFGAMINAAIAITTQLNGQISIFSNNLLKSVRPIITKNEGAGNRNSMLAVSATSSKISFFMMAIMAIPFISETQYILGCWLANVPEWTAAFVQLQIIRSLIEQTTITLTTVIDAEGRIKKWAICSSFINISPAILTYISFTFNASPVMMYIINILIFGIAHSALVIYYAHKNCDLKCLSFLTRQVMPTLVSFAITISIAYASHLFMSEGVFRLLVAVLVACLIYPPTFYTIALNTYEKQTAKSILSSLKKKIQNGIR